MTFETFYTFEELDKIAIFMESFKDGFTTEELLDAAYELTDREYPYSMSEEETQCFCDGWVADAWF